MHPDWIRRSLPAKEAASRKPDPHGKATPASPRGATTANAISLPAKATGIWLLIAVAETLHGMARTLWLVPALGDFRARQVAVFSGSLIVLIIATATTRWIGTRRARDLLGVGALWVALTVAFELFVGRFLLGYAWDRLASDFDLFHGGLLPIGLAVMCMAPLMAARLRASDPDRKEQTDRGVRDHGEH